MAEYSSLIKRIALAIAIAERGEAEITSGIIKRNNPGDIEDPHGSLVEFLTIQEGWNALYHQVSLFFEGSHIYNSNMTISEVAEKYVGTDDWPNWAVNVAQQLGVTTGTQLSQLV